MNHLKSRPRAKKRYGRGCFSSFALSLPDNPHDYCILFPSAQTLGQMCFSARGSSFLIDKALQICFNLTRHKARAARPLRRASAYYDPPT